MAGICWIWLKIAGIAENGWKWQEMGENGWNC